MYNTMVLRSLIGYGLGIIITPTGRGECAPELQKWNALKSTTFPLTQ